jgi:outer membrane murein-binding lipoprotein Lpp
VRDTPATPRDRRIEAIAEQVADLVRRVDAVEREMEATKRANQRAA